MAEENVAAVNDNTNEPQTATEPSNIPADAAETMLGVSGTDTKQSEQQQEAKEAPQEVVYDFKASIPEGVEMDEALTKDFTELAKSMNMTNEQANTVAQFGFKYAEQVASAVKEQYNAEVAKWGENATSEMGANFEKVMSTAGAGIEAVEKVVPGIRQALNETGAGNRIEVIKAFEMLGQLVMADPGKMVNAVGTNAAPTKAQTWYPNSKM